MLIKQELYTCHTQSWAVAFRMRRLAFLFCKYLRQQNMNAELNALLAFNILLRRQEKY